MRIRTSTATALVCVALVGATTPAEAAAPRCGLDAETRCRAAVAAPATSPYAEPLAALGGRTLAQYLADRRAGDPRLR